MSAPQHGILRWLLVLIPCCFIFTKTAQTEQEFAYTKRTHSYSGWSSTVRGDIRTIGLAGATVGLADTFIASGDNPAGLAMSLQNTQGQISANRVYDGDIQNYNEPLVTSNLGAASSVYPWGFSAGYWAPQSEGQRYFLKPEQKLIDPQILTQEFRISAARLFLENKLAVGGSLILGRATETLEFPTAPTLTTQDRSHALGVSAGILYQFPERFLVGVSGTLPITYVFDSNQLSTGISNFFQDVKTPARIGVGVGWIPNRFFRAGLSLYWFGATPQCALLSEDLREVGNNSTFQPRLGVEYLLAELKELEIRIIAGTYLETSRLDFTPSRLHGTGGLELKVWIFSLGWGFDEGPRYENFIYSAGIDVLKILRKLDLIPPEIQPPYGGFFPKPAVLSDEGLARPLIAHWEERQNNPNILDIGRELPMRLEKRIKKTGEDLKYLGKDLQGIGEGLIDILESVPTQIEKGLKTVPGRPTVPKGPAVPGGP